MGQSDFYFTSAGVGRDILEGLVRFSWCIIIHST